MIDKFCKRMNELKLLQRKISLLDGLKDVSSNEESFTGILSPRMQSIVADEIKIREDYLFLSKEANLAILYS
jgi:hypothetical protein